MSKGLKLFVAFFFFLFTGIGIASAYSIGNPAVIWKKKQIRACWITDQAEFNIRTPHTAMTTARASRVSEVRRKTIRDIVRSNFPASLTGTTVVDFQDCPLATEQPYLDSFDLILVNDYFLLSETTKKPYWGESTIGDPNRDPEKSDQGRELAIIAFNFVEPPQRTRDLVQGNFENLASFLPKNFWKILQHKKALQSAVDRAVIEQVRYTVVHEFGHLYGLHHEHYRDDAVKHDFCVSILSTGKDSIRNPNRSGNTFDLFSIMNYCRGDMIDLFNQARLVCELRAPIAKGLGKSKDAVGKAFRSLSQLCPFIEANDMPLGFTDYDKAGLRKLYFPNETTPDPKYLDSKTKVQWIEVFKRTHSLMKAAEPPAPSFSTSPSR